MNLIAYQTLSPRLEIRPAPVERDWMTATSDQFAYRCLPLNIANSHGWEILCPVSFGVRWNGGPRLEDIQIYVYPEAAQSLPTANCVASHFGRGVVTFQTGFVFRTDPEHNLLFTGPVNRPKDGISPLTGVVESDWAPYGVTMNWQLTRINTWVSFRKGEPFCFFFPIPRGALQRVTPEFRDLASNPELKKENEEWRLSRKTFNAHLRLSGTEAQKEGWQKQYFQGKLPDGQSTLNSHETRLKLRPFADITSESLKTSSDAK